MLQIRLSKGPSSDGGGTPVRTVPPLETVTVACPEHLVIADLPVAKSVGLLPAVFASSGRNMGRRSRRQLGDRTHFCVRCDFPIAIYGRLIPCEHAFCLACARSDPTCYLCDERVQKIQTIKMLEGIFICAAPHCLKSFLKKAEFVSHVNDTHADIIQLNAEKEGGSEINNLNFARPSSADIQKQSSLPEASTARAPPRSTFSPSSNSQPPDREDRVHRFPSRDQSYSRPPQLRPPPFPSSQSYPPGDIPSESNIAQVSDRPYNWFPPPHRLDNNQGSMQYQQDTDQFPLERSSGAPPESMFPNFVAQFPHQSNYPIPGNSNQPLITAPFNFSPFPADGSQPFFGAPLELTRPESAQSEGGSEQGSVLGIPPAPTGVAGFRENFPRPWGMDLMSMPFQPMPVVQAIPDGFVNPADSQAGVTFFQGDLGQGLLLNLPGKESDQQNASGNQIDGKSLLSSLPGQMQSSISLPPPPPLPPPLSLQFRPRFTGSGEPTKESQVIGWHNDKGRFGNWPD